MSLSTITPLLIEATNEKRALGAYNVYAEAQVDALIKIHEKYETPLIIQVADPANGFLGGDSDFMNSDTESRKAGAVHIAKKFQEAAKETNISVCLHLDHGKTMTAIKTAIEAGFTSVMFDGSHLPFEENIRQTKKAADYAHSKGVSIEGELGVLGGVEDDIVAEKSLFTHPEEALEFVQKTGVDCLAISYGTQHGPNKGKDAKLRTDIVRDVKALLEKNGLTCPLVSHGSSSVPQDIVEGLNKLGATINNAYGIDGDQMQAAIAEGIAKINVDTDIRLATTLALKEYFSSTDDIDSDMNPIKDILEKDKTLFDPKVYLGPVIGQISGKESKSNAMFLLESIMGRGIFNICERTIPLFNGAKS